MGKVYSHCLGRIIDKSAKWEIISEPPSEDLLNGSNSDWNNYWDLKEEWVRKQPPRPEQIGICCKCGEKYYNRRIGLICYKRFYQKR